jgi:hypothetical protein
MAILYDIQPDNEPIEWTHFDSWFDDKEDEEIYTDKELFTRAIEIIDTWAVNLSITINVPNFNHVDLEDGFDLVIMQLLEHGFNVYKGSDFIEIYEGE